METIQIPTPTITPINKPYWEALCKGQLHFQRCSNCDNAWLPPREECPRCLSDRFAWEQASGRGSIVSWVIYRQAFHPAFKDQVPYNVAVIELIEGPRLISNINGDENEFTIGAQVEFCPAELEGTAVASFTLSTGMAR